MIFKAGAITQNKIEQSKGVARYGFLPLNQDVGKAILVDIFGSVNFPFLADKLAADTSVDAGSAYAASFANLAWSETKGDSGGWVPAPQRGYVGVAFDFQGNTHYGSLDVEVSQFTAIFNSPSSEFDATLHGFAWETIPGSPILAGAAPALPPATSIPTGSFVGALLLVVALCSLGLRRLRQQSI